MGRRQEQRAAKRKIQEAAEVENIDMKAGDVRQDAAKRADAGLKHGLSTRMENGAATRRAEELRSAFEIIDNNQVKIKDHRLLRIYYDLKESGVYDFGEAVKVFRQELEGNDQDEYEPAEPKGRKPKDGEVIPHRRGHGSARLHLSHAAQGRGEKTDLLAQVAGAVTEIQAAETFWPAEEYHQQYLEKGGRFGSGQSAAKGCTDKIRCYG